MMNKIVAFASMALIFTSCSSFKAERVDTQTSDEKALKITDSWMGQDTVLAVKEVLAQLEKHKGFQKYLAKKQGTPKLFVAEVQNNTAEAYFPIDDMNDELLNELSASGEYVLIDAKARDKILKEITYQNEGMVDPKTVKSIGKQTGADLMIFGNVYMKPESRDGKTIKQYTVNLRMTDIETAEEVARTRAKIDKFSEKSSVGW